MFLGDKVGIEVISGTAPFKCVSHTQLLAKLEWHFPM